MRTARLWPTCLAAILAIAIGSAAAAAAEVTIEPAGAIDMTTNAFTIASGIGSIICRLEFDGSLEEGPINDEIEGSLVGRITEAFIDNDDCSDTFPFSSGDPIVEASLGLPWHVRYVGIDEPNRYRFVLLTVQLLILLDNILTGRISCLYSWHQEFTITLPEAGGGQVADLDVDPDASIAGTRLELGRVACPNLAVLGAFALDPVQTIIR